MKEALLTFSKRLEYLGIDRIINDADLVLVAFSGGADSSLLLHLLAHYLKDSRVSLAACHLNHLIRGEEAFRDERFAEETAKKLGVPFYSKRVDIPALCKDGGSVEETARRERYAFFDEIAERSGKNTVIATAHNADDNLETVLFNLVRGTGIAGLCGIPPVREGKYVRPLIFYSSAEIRSLADVLNIPYVTDSTNLETDYTRNKLRHLVIPYLRELNPSAERSVMRMCEGLREDDDFINACALGFLEENGNGTIQRDSLRALHGAVLARVLVLMFEPLKNMGCPSLESVHIRDIIRLINGKDGDFSVSVPGKAIFLCEREACSFTLPTGNEMTDDSVSVLEIGRPLYKNGYVILCTDSENGEMFPIENNIYNLSINARIKFDKIKGKLEVRIRQNGDVIRFGGMTRKLKKLYSDKKIPRSLRDRLPVICDEDGILWVPSFPVRDGMKSNGSEKSLTLFCLKEADFKRMYDSPSD